MWATILSAIVPTVAVIWTHFSTKEQLVQVHSVVNGRFETALARIKLLEAEVRRLLQDIEAQQERPPNSS